MWQTVEEADDKAEKQADSERTAHGGEAGSKEEGPDYTWIFMRRIIFVFFCQFSREVVSAAGEQREFKWEQATKHWAKHKRGKRSFWVFFQLFFFCLSVALHHYTKAAVSRERRWKWNRCRTAEVPRWKVEAVWNWFKTGQKNKKKTNTGHEPSVTRRKLWKSRHWERIRKRVRVKWTWKPMRGWKENTWTWQSNRRRHNVPLGKDLAGKHDERGQTDGQPGRAESQPDKQSGHFWRKTEEGKRTQDDNDTKARLCSLTPGKTEPGDDQGQKKEQRLKPPHVYREVRGTFPWKAPLFSLCCSHLSKKEHRFSWLMTGGRNPQSATFTQKTVDYDFQWPLKVLQRKK